MTKLVMIVATLRHERKMITEPKRWVVVVTDATKRINSKEDLEDRVLFLCLVFTFHRFLTSGKYDVAKTVRVCKSGGNVC